jgi:AcrR family transcriptional regulator
MSSPPRSRRRPPYHHGALASALVDAARGLLEERGASAVTLREVARRVGVTHAAPYRHFRGKDALLAAVAEDGWHELGRRLGEARREARTTSAALAAMGSAYLAFARSHCARYALMMQAARGEIGHGPVPSTPGEAQDLEGVVQGALEATLPAGAAVAGARLVWSLWHGLATLPPGTPIPGDEVLLGTGAAALLDRLRVASPSDRSG